MMVEFERSLKRVLKKLADARDVLRASELVYGVLLFLAFLCGAVTVAFLADNLLWLPNWLRGILFFVLLGGAVIVLLFYTVLPLKKRVSDVAVAVRVERSCGRSDNILVNAVQLSQEKRMDGVGHVFVKAIVDEAAEFAERVDAEKVAPKERLKKAKWVALVCGCILLIYLVVAPAYFKNALTRYVRFSSFISPITKTKLSVEPGDARVVWGEPFEVRVKVEGEIPSNASVKTREGTPVNMEFNGSEFTYKFVSVKEPFEYSVSAGDACSRFYMVEVVYIPRIERMDVTIEYPAYTGIEPLRIEETSGNIEVLVGSIVTIEVTAKQKLAEAKILLGNKVLEGVIDGNRAVWSLSPKESSQYRITLADFEGHRTEYDYQLTVTQDEIPTIQCIAPASDMLINKDGKKHEVALVYRANDDVGVRGVELEIKLPDGRTAKDGWQHQPGSRTVSGSYLLKIDTREFKSGDVVSFRFSCTDGHPSHKPATTRLYNLRIMDSNDQKLLASRNILDLQQKIRELLGREIRLKDMTNEVLAVLSGVDVKRRIEQLEKQQMSIAEDTFKVAAAVEPVSVYERRICDRLRSLSTGMMKDVVCLLKNASVGEGDIRKKSLTDALEKEDEIIAALKSLLEEIQAAITELKRSETVKTEEQKMSLKEAEQFLARLKESLQEFIKEQKEALEKSKELAKKQVEDWTKGDERLLGEALETEQKWEKYFEDLKDDLSRLPEQDFSDSTQAKELIEIYEEVKLAEDALTRRAVEMAVPHEQAATEKAEELTENLDRWLSDVRDYQKWVMEDIPEPDEIPLTDLPDELEDIVGELIDEEEGLAEEVEDVSSGWADSLNKGAGWTAMDGPISNMSAKGVTGNLLPNKNEVGGRSGEGRMGRSSGQFVEQEATGKGGRQTPTRLTSDPYERGSVKDTSREAPGGATGGGKLSGMGKEGLRGPTPPELKQELERLASKQADIAQKAERLSRNFNKMGVDASGVEDAAGQMRAASEALRNGELNEFVQKKQLAVDRLKEQQAVVASEVRARQERLGAIPKDLREEIMNAIKEKMADEYKELLKAYYKNIADEAANRSSVKREEKEK
ncbi:MAG: hypothetical protein N2234_01370 [Planctomycetota bacterium]|nr:hypothetical protein [Planctomycetota bacterium]